MKIVRFHEFGGPEVLQIEEVPTPEPGPTEILVKVETIGIGVPDIMMYTGIYPWCPPLPVIPGNELAGRVTTVGSEVTRFKEGDRVYITARELPQRGGCCVEFIAVDESVPYAIPTNVRNEDIVGVGNFHLAWMLLNYAANPTAEQTILVHAAAGGVGSAIVQLAKHKGLTVFGVVSNTEKGRYVSDLGADAVIDRRSENVGDRISELTNGRGVDVIYDPVAGPDFAKNFDNLAVLGVVVMFGFLAGHPDADIYTPMREHFENSHAFRVFSIHMLDERPDLRRQTLEEVMAAMDSGKISPRIHAKMKLEDAADAFRMLDGSEVIGKIILTANTN